MLNNSEEQLTLFVADSHAKTSAKQVGKKVLMGKDQVYTSTRLELLASVDHDTQFLKTSQACLLEDPGNGSLGFSMIWPRSGLMQNGTVYRLPTLAPPITEIGSGLLPTPTASEGTGAQPNKGRQGGRSLREVVMYPTPVASEVRQGWQSRAGPGKGTQQSLSTLVMKSEGRESGKVWEGGQLNPVWVEWLMGFPAGHTDLNS